MENLQLQDVMLYLFTDYCIKHATPQQMIKLVEIMKGDDTDIIIGEMVQLFDLAFVKEQLKIMPDFIKILDNITTSNTFIDDALDVNEKKKMKVIVEKIPLSAFTWKK